MKREGWKGWLRGMAGVLAALGLITGACAAERVIATSTRAMSPNRTINSLGARVEETALGDYVADAMRAVAGTEAAILTGDCLEKSLPGGDITEEKAREAVKAGEKVLVLEVTEKELFSLLERGVGTLALTDEETIDPESGWYGFPQISGFYMTYDVSQKPGKRVTEVTLDSGKSLNRRGSGTVRLAMTEGMAAEYGYAAGGEDAGEVAGTLGDILCGYLEAQGEVEIPELGRMEVLGNQGETLYEMVHAQIWLPFLILLILLIRLPRQKGKERNADGSFSDRYRK